MAAEPAAPHAAARGGPRLGVVPILWANDDVPELTAPPPAWTTILDEAAACGFEGIELGSGFPRDPGAVREGLSRRRLRLAAGYFAGGLAEPAEAQEELARALERAEQVKACGARVLVVADRFRAPRALDEARLSTFALSLGALGGECRRMGMRLAFHNHAGTGVERPEELEALMARTDPEEVALCLDTGHLLLGGGAPVEAARRYGPRIVHVHLKSVEPEVAARYRAGGLGFLDALRARVFCELGSGALDVAATLGALREAGAAPGWVVIEQDTTRLPPRESAARSHAAVRAAWPW